ncbi:MAG: YihY family inner membrane protein [Betaproteobacteria bacterium]|nr:MAG: YihY family inner membrane protein [Betaproteobacteria bacterium]
MFARLMAFVSFISRLRRRLTGVEVGRTAASLAFTTLLGLVPLFTVAFAYVSRFPLFARSQDAFEAFLLRFFLPGSGAVVRHYLTEFVAKSGELKGVSTLFVVITAVLLVWQVDREINTIWGTREPRSFARRIFVYALALTAGPALIGAGIYFIDWLIEQSIAATSLDAQALTLLVQPVALIVDTAVFTLIYAFVPARSVPFKLALVGGLLAAIAFEAAKHGFRFYITQVPTYQVIYGALATLPLFLIWIYLSWVIVLVGAAITATLAERHGRGRRR